MVLKAIELRIGNYYQENGTYYKTTPNDIINLIRCEASKTKSDMQPIPLTEEILMKSGFIKNKYKETYESYSFNGYRIINDKNEYDFLIYGSSVIIAKLCSLHQLQNLYFDLTQKELEVKL